MIHIEITTVNEAFKVIMLISLVSLIAASAAMMFQYFMMPNMVFYPWAVLLLHISIKGECLRHLMRPLGRCRYCNSIWITMFIFKYLFGWHFLMFAAMAITFIFIWILDHYVMKHVDPNKKVEDKYKVKFASDTPWPAMIKAYYILIPFYVVTYIIIPATV